MTFPIVSRRSSPTSRCVRRGNQTGCYTTGWQDHVEVTRKVRAMWLRDRAVMDARVQRLFKRHARSMPTFVARATFHVTDEDWYDLRLFIATQCSTDAPEWDRRPRPTERGGCYLWTILGYS